MSSYVRTRLTLVIPVLLGVSIAVFAMLRLLPGDPAQIMLAESGASADKVAALRHELGLDDPLPLQYWRFLSGALHGDLGRSIQSNRPVIQEIAAQLPSTIELTVAAMIVALAIGIPLGLLAATHHNGLLDFGSMAVALGGVSMPSFWLGVLLILFFSLKLGWLPATGQGGLERLILPAFTLGFGAAAIIARLVRSSVLEVLRHEYVTTARAKGLSPRVVLLRHALKNALIPVVTLVGLQFGALLAGTVVIETVFSRPGIGRMVVNAILVKDFPVVQGAILIIATTYVLANLLVDLLYAWLDPRVHYG
jgi:ABC-type dipeptide/oligopeptide/nickel transport system permease component